jgi:hypothetical protein
VRSPTGADEVRVIRIRESIRLRAGGRDHRVLVSASTRSLAPASASTSAIVSPPFAYATAWRPAVEDGERRERREELGAFERGGPNLEVRPARTAQRAAAEQRSAEVGGPTARPRDDAARAAARPA